MFLSGMEEAGQHLLAASLLNSLRGAAGEQGCGFEFKVVLQQLQGLASKVSLASKGGHSSDSWAWKGATVHTRTLLDACRRCGSTPRGRVDLLTCRHSAPQASSETSR